MHMSSFFIMIPFFANKIGARERQIKVFSSYLWTLQWVVWNNVCFSWQVKVGDLCTKLHTILKFTLVLNACLELRLACNLGRICWIHYSILHLVYDFALILGFELFKGCAVALPGAAFGSLLHDQVKPSSTWLNHLDLIFYMIASLHNTNHFLERY